MNRLKRLPGIFALFAVAFGLLISCGLTDPSLDKEFGYIYFDIGNKAALIEAIDEAKHTIDVAMYEIDDIQLISALNRAANRDVKIRVLVDKENIGDIIENIIPLSPAIPARGGNENGNMEANFLIIDGIEVKLLSSSRTFDNRFIMFSVVDEHFVHDFEKEFNQMFILTNFGVGNGVYGRKTELSYNLKYEIGGNIVEVYFLPQNNPMSFLYSHIAKSKHSVGLYSRYIDNNKFYAIWNEFVNSGVTGKVRLGNEATNKVDIYNNWILNPEVETKVLSQNFDFNIAFCDIGKKYQSFAMTTYNLNQTSPLLHSDGVLILVRGELAGSLFDETDKFLSEIPPLVLDDVEEVIITNRVAYHNVVFNELGFMRIGNEWLGDFFELKNLTEYYVDLSGYTIVITNNNRLGEPNLFTMPYGTVLSPGGYFVVAGDSLVYSYIDLVWDDMFVMSSGFMYCLFDPENNLIDVAGDIEDGMGGFSGGLGGVINAFQTDVSITRRTSPAVLSGTTSAGWVNTSTAKNINPAYQGEIIASPGAD